MKFVSKSVFSSATCLQSAALAAALIGAASASTASAQAVTAVPAAPAVDCLDANADGTCDVAAETNADGSTKDEGIVVTGSRIRLPNLSGKEPVVTVSAAYIEDRGLTNVADALNEIPGFRIESSPFGGIKDSGLGVKEGVIEAIKGYSYVKTFSLPW